MKRIGLIALALLSVLGVAEARPKAAPQPRVTRVNSDENAYSYHNYRTARVAQSAPVSGVVARPYSYNQGYAHIIPPDGFGPPPSAYSMGPGWANRQGFYGSGTIAYPYNAGGFVNTGFYNGGFFPGRY